jgi:voltage-gated potassium channel Kch
MFDGSGAGALVIGDLEATRLACSLLAERGAAVTHLLAPSDRDVAGALAAGPVQAVVVIVHSDVQALRYALLASHAQPGVRIVTTLFDKTVADQLTEVVPNCVAASPAEIAAPAIVGAALEAGALAIDDTPTGPVLVSPPEDAAGRPATTRPWRPPERGLRLRDLVPRWHGGVSVLLVGGLVGLASILLLDWVLTVLVLHQPVVDGLYAATRTVATVGPGDADAQHAPGWYLVVAAVFMLLAIVFTGTFVAGLVDWLLSTRSVGLIGRLALPDRNHVVVAGLGQVGLRACLSLQRLGVRCVAIERDPRADNLRLARDAGIPVLVGHAEDRATMARVRLHRARALVALGSDELDNIAIAMTALAAAPQTRIVLRAGEDPVVAETRSLFRIGRVVDVAALAAVTTVLHASGCRPALAFGVDGEVHALLADGEFVSHRPSRCECAAA